MLLLLLLLVITFSRLIFNPACGNLNRENMNFPYTRSRLRIWSRETGSAVPSRVSLLILHAQAESGAYSRTPLFPPAFHHGVVSAPEKRHRVSLTQKLRSNGVTTESPPGTGPLVPYGSSSNIGVLPFQVTPLTNFPLLVQWACAISPMRLPLEACRDI